MVSPRRHGRGGSLALRAFSAAVLVAGAAAALALLHDGYVQDGAWQLARRALERRWLAGFLWTLPVAAIAAWGLAALDRAPVRPRWRALGFLAALVPGYLFVSFRLPPDAVYAPGLDGTRALTAHALAVVAALAGAWFVAPRTRVPGLAAIAALGLVALVGAAVDARLPRAVLASASDTRGASHPRRPNVILISLDTLRADRVGAYGYLAGTTPEIDRFALGARRFTNAYTPQAWTLAAHMTMLTGLNPTEHGVNEQRMLSSGVPTLAERLDAQGYATIGVVDTCVWLDPRYGFARGFDVYRQLWNDADYKIDRILHHLDNVGDQPFFLLAHFFDPHSDHYQLPYDADDTDRALFADWYWDEFTGCDELLGCASEYLTGVNRENVELDADRVEWLSSLYDAGVRSMDRKLGRLFRELERRGLFESSIIVLTSDHGEEFGEHGKLLHEQAYTECVRVPLFLRTPEIAAAGPEVSDELVGLIDILPTLLDATGLEAPELEGRSLLDLASQRAPEHLVLDSGDGLNGLTTARWAAIREDGGWRAYDLVNDPRQQRPIAPGESAALAPEARLLLAAAEEAEYRLRARARHGEPTENPLAPEQRAALRALGYAGD